MIVVGLSGVAGVGKDVGAAALVRDLGFVRIGFADALREALYRLNPLVQGINHPHYGPYDAYRLADVVDYLGWEVAKRLCEEIRELQQRMGTEVGREIFGQDVWVEALFDRAEREGVERLVIPDVRFPNEYRSVAEHGYGLCFRITRPGFGPINDHASDNALTDADFEHEDIMDNDTDEEHYQLRLVGQVARLIARGYFG